MDDEVWHSLTALKLALREKSLNVVIGKLLVSYSFYRKRKETKR